MQLFSSDCYKNALKLRLRQKKLTVTSAYTFEKMAQACGVQKTYLSRVLNSDGSHLSEEQLEMCGNYLGLSKEEREFTQLLRRRQRASTQGVRKEWSQDLEKYRRRYMQTDQYLQVENQHTEAADWSAYYLDPLVILTHIFLTVEKYRKDLSLIQKALDISTDRLDEILKSLETLGLIRLSTNGYSLTSRKTHLPMNSPLYRAFRSAQRLRAIERMDKAPQEKAYSFSVAFSSDPEVRKEIHRRLLELIGDVEKMVDEGKEEEVYQLNVDLFDWT